MNCLIGSRNLWINREEVRQRSNCYDASRMTGGQVYEMDEIQN